MSGVEENCLISLDVKGRIRVTGVERWQEVGERAVLCCVWDEWEIVDRELKETLVRAERGKRSWNRCKEEERIEWRKGRGGRDFFAKIAGWGAAGKVLWCCVRKNWREAYWKESKEEVSGRDMEMDLGVDGVWEWRYMCYDFLGIKSKESEKRNISAWRKSESGKSVDGKFSIFV